MTEYQALHPDANDLENNFKNNSRKKTYAEVIQATTMEESSRDEAKDDLEDHSWWCSDRQSNEAVQNGIVLVCPDPEKDNRGYVALVWRVPRSLRCQS